MANTMTDTRPQFSRLTDGGAASRSWKAAVPAVVVSAPSPKAARLSHLWFTPQAGDPIDLGALDADGDGNAFVMVSELPAVDQGKAVVLTADAPGSKQPGDVIASAELPKLKPQHAAPASAETPQAKSGNTSQQMHQQQSEPAPGK